VLRLATKLVGTHNAENLGGIFFVTPDVSPTDQAYWKQLGVDCFWVRASLEGVIHRITQRLGSLK
jgi:hypothetical protein